MKNKILIFNGYYYPSRNCGGPITSIENIVNACSDDFDFYIICYNHDFNDSTPFNIELNKWHTVAKAQVMYVEKGYLDFSHLNMRTLLSKLHPDLIWFSGVLTPNNKLVAVYEAKKQNIPVLFSPRGEVSSDRVKLKAYKKVPYLNMLKITGMYKNCYFHATSDDEYDGIMKYFSPDSKHIFKVANIAILKQPDVVKYSKEKGVLKVFFFSRIHEVKNVLYAIECVSQCKENIVFDIFGPIESQDYWHSCLEAIRKTPSNITVNYCGILDKSSMSTELQKRDCFLFPTLNENYGHVIAESLANGRPILLSQGTTPWDDLDGEAGYVVDLRNPEIFTEKLDYYAHMNNEAYMKIITSSKAYFAKKINKDSAIEGHKRMFKEMIKNDKNKAK